MSPESVSAQRDLVDVLQLRSDLKKAVQKREWGDNCLNICDQYRRHLDKQLYIRAKKFVETYEAHDLNEPKKLPEARNSGGNRETDNRRNGRDEVNR